MTEEKRNFGGIVLCGGESRRMGTSKAWLSFGGEALLQRIVRVLRAVVEPVAVVAAVGQELPVLSADVLVVLDSQPGRGPMQGLADGLAALVGRADAAFVSSCDMPLLRPQFVARMIELFAARGERQRPEFTLETPPGSPVADAPGAPLICVPRADGRLHPLAAIYDLQVLPTVKKLLHEDRRRLMGLFDEVPTRIVATEELADVDPLLQSLRNLNKQEDYRAALEEAAGNSGSTM